MTEGEKTEPNYLNALTKRLELSIADVEILRPEEGNDPLTLTRKAIELRENRKKAAKKDLTVLAYDEVWVVFDLEDPKKSANRAKARDAMELKEAKSIRFAQSNPSFEYWLLLHEEYTTAEFADCQAVTSRFRNYWKNYDKNWKPPERFLEKLPHAVTRAQQCRSFHKSSNGCGNPSTAVDGLARSLNSATRPYLQFQLREPVAKVDEEAQK